MLPEAAGPIPVADVERLGSEDRQRRRRRRRRPWPAPPARSSRRASRARPASGSRPRRDLHQQPSHRVSSQRLRGGQSLSNATDAKDAIGLGGQCVERRAVQRVDQDRDDVVLPVEQIQPESPWPPRTARGPTPARGPTIRGPCPGTSQPRHALPDPHLGELRGDDAGSTATARRLGPPPARPRPADLPRPARPPRHHPGRDRQGRRARGPRRGQRVRPSSW